MSSVARKVLAGVAGVVVAVAVVFLSDTLVRRVFPLPSALELRDPEVARAAIAAVPLPALVLLVVGWAVAGGLGAYVAVRLVPERRMLVGVVVAAILVLATVANLAMVPHPAWMWPASLVLIPLLGWAGARVAAPRSAPHHQVVPGA